MAALIENRTPANIKWESNITLDLELYILHGTSLMLQNVQWSVANQIVSESLMERPLLNALGFTKADIFATTADRFIGMVDLSH